MGNGLSCSIFLDIWTGTWLKETYTLTCSQKWVITCIGKRQSGIRGATSIQQPKQTSWSYGSHTKDFEFIPYFPVYNCTYQLRYLLFLWEKKWEDEWPYKCEDKNEAMLLRGWGGSIWTAQPNWERCPHLVTQTDSGDHELIFAASSVWLMKYKLMSNDFSSC